MIALRTSSMSVKSGMLFFVSSAIKKRRVCPFISFVFKSNRKLHSLLLPLNLNLNYENLFVFSAKVRLLFDMTKYFGKKMLNFLLFYANYTISPLKVAADASKMRTWTRSPIFCPVRGKTTVLYCSVRPYMSS